MIQRERSHYIVNPPLELGIGKRTNHTDSTRKHCTGRALRSKSLLGRAPQPLAARNRCSGVPRSHLALEITARARFFVFGNTCKRHPSLSFSHIPFELTARACWALFEGVLRSARSRSSNKRRWIRQHFRVSCGIPFEIALLRSLLEQPSLDSTTLSCSPRNPFRHRSASSYALLRAVHCFCFELCYAFLGRVQGSESEC